MAGLVIWSLPLGLEPTLQKALAILAFMLVYWMWEPIDYGITALLGCYLFWALHVTKFSVAFSGFATTTPWFVFGVLLLGEAASRSGLARRIGYLVIQRVGTSYSRLLLGFVILVWLLSFLIPAPNALIPTLAPVALGIVAAFGWGPHTLPATGLFIMLTYTSTLFSKMFLGSAPMVLTAGIIEAHTGVQVLWSQWLLALLPAVPPTILAAWLTVRWLYPAGRDDLSSGQGSLQAALQAMGPWSQEEKKTLAWLLAAIALWATDFLHHLSPAVIAIGVGLLLTLPKVGVLDAKGLKQVNFLLVLFIGGALSMGSVLIETKALNLLLETLVTGIAPWLTTAFNASIILYWANFLYHFLLGNELTLVSTSLPVLLTLGEGQGYNPVVVGMIWAFAGGGKLFIYQSSPLMVGYAYGYFTGRDVLKVGAVLTIVEGLVLMVLVPLYWPLIGLPWIKEPQTPAFAQASPLPQGIYVQRHPDLQEPWAAGAHIHVTWARVEPQRGLYDWRAIEEDATVVAAVRSGKPFGLQISFHGTPGKPGSPGWAGVPQIEALLQPGKARTWSAIWSPEFQREFPHFVQALAKQYDGDPRLAYVVMTDDTALPYTANPKLWDKSGYTVAGYTAAYQQIYQTYLQGFRNTPLVAAITWFGAESKSALRGRAEEQALRELLEFAGSRGLHFFLPERVIRDGSRTAYLTEAILLPAVRTHAPRSQVLLLLEPGARKAVWATGLQRAQQLWPELPVGAVILRAPSNATTDIARHTPAPKRSEPRPASRDPGAEAGQMVVTQEGVWRLSIDK